MATVYLREPREVRMILGAGPETERKIMSILKVLERVLRAAGVDYHCSGAGTIRCFSERESG